MGPAVEVPVNARTMILLLALMPTLAFAAEERRASKTPPPDAVQPAPGEQPLAIVPGDAPVAPGPQAEPPAEPAWQEPQPPVHPANAARPAPPAPPVEPTPEPVARVVRPQPRKRKRMGLAGGFGHVGFGGGLAIDPINRTASPELRFSLGGTGFALAFYWGGSLEIAHTGYTPMSLGGVGRTGLALPLPRGKFLFGVHGGGGGHLDSAGPGPQVLAGPEVGFVAMGKRGKRGVRFLVEAEAVGKPTKQQVYVQWGANFALAF